MEQKINWQRKFSSWTRNKKMFYPLLAVVILVVVLAGIWFFHYEAQLAAKKAAQLQAQKAAQQLLQKKRNATYSRLSLFLNGQAGGAINLPSYLEGYFRINDTSNVDKKTTISYIKNSAFVSPLMYFRFDSKADFKLAAGEIELKTDSPKYSYAYFFYPVDSYPGSDKADYSSMQNDFKDALSSFGL